MPWREQQEFQILINIRYEIIALTHIWLADFSILINRASPFPNSGVSGAFFYFEFIFGRISCKQIVQTLIKCHVLWRLIWVCTVCLCPKNGTLGLYRLRSSHKLNCNTLKVVDIDSDPIYLRLVNNRTAKICCLGLILALFKALWSLKWFWIISEVVINCF